MDVFLLLLDSEWSKVLLPGGNIKMDAHTIRKPSLSSPSLAFLQGWKSSGLGNVSDRAVSLNSNPSFCL